MVYMFSNVPVCFGQANFSSGTEAKKSFYKPDVSNLVRVRTPLSETRARLCGAAESPCGATPHQRYTKATCLLRLFEILPGPISNPEKIVRQA